MASKLKTAAPPIAAKPVVKTTKLAPPRRPQTLPVFEGPKVLVLTEKHGVYHYLIRNEAHLHAIALRILNSRMEGGYVVPEEECQVDEEDLRKLKEELPRIEAIENEKIRKASMEVWESQMASLKMDQECLDQTKSIRRVLAAKNGAAAWGILQERSENEYEHVELGYFQNVINDEEEAAYLPRPKKPRHGRTWVDSDGKRWVYDAKTIKDWIPRVFGRLLYDVQSFQGKDVVQLPWEELNSYDEPTKA